MEDAFLCELKNRAYHFFLLFSVHHYKKYSIGSSELCLNQRQYSMGTRSCSPPEPPHRNPSFPGSPSTSLMTICDLSSIPPPPLELPPGGPHTSSRESNTNSSCCWAGRRLAKIANFRIPFPGGLLTRLMCFVRPQMLF